MLNWPWLFMNSSTEGLLSPISAANILSVLSTEAAMVYTNVCVFRKCYAIGFNAFQYATVG